MSLNRTARGIVLVPSLLLGGAFLATAAWVDGPAAANRPLALGLGGVLRAAGLLAQLLPDPKPAEDPSGSQAPGTKAGTKGRIDRPRGGKPADPD
jgi:hypothetical protein